MYYHIISYTFQDQSKIPSDTDNLFIRSVESLKDLPFVLGAQCGKIDKIPYEGSLKRNQDLTHSLLIVLKEKKNVKDLEEHPMYKIIKSQIIIPNLELESTLPVIAFGYNGQLPEPLTSSSTISNIFLVIKSSFISSILTTATLGLLYYKYSKK